MHTSLIPLLGEAEAGSLWVQGQAGLNGEQLQDRCDYVGRLLFQDLNKNKRKEKQIQNVKSKFAAVA